MAVATRTTTKLKDKKPHPLDRTVIFGGIRYYDYVWDTQEEANEFFGLGKTETGKALKPGEI